VLSKDNISTSCTTFFSRLIGSPIDFLYEANHDPVQQFHPL